MEDRKDICEGYERDSVQQLDKLAKDKNERFSIYPLTYIQAVYDARTKERLDSILWKCNNVYLPWMGSAGDTRIQLPFWMRRKGIIITYKNLDEETITEKLTYDLCIADDFFRLDSSWTRITDALPVGGNITIGSNGNWFQDGVDTGFKAQGPKGDNGLTPMLRTVNNKLRYSYDGEVWNEISEYIAAWFRYQDNKIQISRDQKTWSDLSKPFTQDLYIKGYVATSSALPSTGVKQGDIYMVGPTYAAEDTEHKNPIYRMYVYNDSGWVDNGVFQSIAAGVVQTIGNSETEVMSQKAVSSIVGLDTYPVFSDTKPYVKGEIVNYGGLLYEFTADHAKGAWSGTDVRDTSLRDEMITFVAGQALNSDSQVINLSGESGTHFLLNLKSGTTIKIQVTDKNYPHNVTLRKNINVTEGQVVVINSGNEDSDSTEITITEDFPYLAVYSENDSDSTVSVKINKRLNENVINNKASSFINYYVDSNDRDFRNEKIELIDAESITWRQGRIDYFNGSIIPSNVNITSDFLTKDVDDVVIVVSEDYSSNVDIKNFYVLVGIYDDDGNLINKYSKLYNKNYSDLQLNIPSKKYRISIYNPDGVTDSDISKYKLNIGLSRKHLLPTINWGCSNYEMYSNIKEAIRNITIFNDNYKNLYLQYFGTSYTENILSPTTFLLGIVRNDNITEEYLPTSTNDTFIAVNSALSSFGSGVKTLSLRASDTTIGTITVDFNKLSGYYLRPSVSKTYAQSSLKEFMLDPYLKEKLLIDEGQAVTFSLDWVYMTNTRTYANAFLQLPIKKGETYFISVECKDAVIVALWNADKESQSILSNSTQTTFTAKINSDHISIYRQIITDKGPVKVTIKKVVSETGGNNHITVAKVSDTQLRVNVYTASNNKTFTHNFTREKYSLDVPYGDGLTKNLVTHDVWYSGNTIYDDKPLIQGNTNFIYRVDDTVSGFEDENTFCGASHGCIRMEYYNFFADGKELTIDDITEPIVCNNFRMIQKAIGYAVSKSITNELGNEGNRVYPKLTEEGDLIPTTSNFIDVTYTSDNKVVENNRLVMLRDGIKFRVCYGSMLCCYPPFFNNLIINNKENTWNSYVIKDDSNCALTREGGSLIDLSTDDTHFAYEALQYGENIFVKNSMLRKDDRKNKDTVVYIWSQGTPDNRIKVYFQACNTKEQTVEGVVQDVFNEGDELDVVNIREINYNM